MLIKKKVFFLLICITILALSLTGCYDLGDGTEDDDDYCETYSEIRVIKGADDVTYYTMEDFYNKAAVNDFESPMSTDERSEYSYLIVKSEKSLSLGEIAVYFESTAEETLSVSFFLLDESALPTKVYTGQSGPYKREECNEPDPSASLGKATCKLAGVENKWSAIYLRSWSDGDSVTKRHPIESGQYIVIRIDNNCYDTALADYEDAEAEWTRIREEYDQKLTEWQAVNADPSATQTARDAAMAALSQALAAKTAGERDYEVARREYENNKSPYNKVSVRMTAILIYAEQRS